jgi:hypothetical protein
MVEIVSRKAQNINYEMAGMVWQSILLCSFFIVAVSMSRGGLHEFFYSASICVEWSHDRRNVRGEWVRSGMTTNALVWGVEGGLQFALHPGGFTKGDGGPRGLIRIGYPTLMNGGYDLINFIAVEPIVNKSKGFSELEKSSSEGKPGKLFWVGKPERWGDGALDPERS